MNFKMVIDSEMQKKNCKAYATSYYKAVDILRESKGKQNYKVIAKKLGIPDYRVSSLQKKAEGLGLAKKLDNGCYKRLPGVLGMMPSVKQAEKKKISIPELAKKLKKRRKSPSPQVNIGVPSRVQSSLGKMAKAYELLYLTENILRELIRKVFQGVPDWWKKRVHPNIQKAVQETISKTPYHAAQRHDELEYAHLGQLKEIITSKQNWNDFLPYLNERDKKAFQVTIDRAIPSRNSIGHCIPLNKDDQGKVSVRFQDILQMLK